MALSAIGTLAGVSLLTARLTPADFGLLSLLLAISVLATQIAAGPVAQATIHLYPGFSTPARLPLLRSRASHAQRQGWLLVAALLLAGGGVAMALGRATWVDVALVLLLFSADSSRTLRISVLNAARRHAPYSIWVALDAWARPVAALAAIVAFGAVAQVALAAYVAVAVVLNLLFGRAAWRCAAADGAPVAVPSGTDDAEPGRLDRKIARYALPLVPLALLAWVVNLGDRFAVGAILDEAAVGIYAAAYGLAAAPFMMLAGMVEQAVRPHYQQALSARNHLHADRLLRIWLLTVAAAVCAGWALFLVAHELIASWVLGPAFIASAALMPWIAGGYALRATASVFERVCYGYARTRRVLAIQAATATTAVVAVPAAAAQWGLRGAAASLVLVFSVQLAVAAMFAFRTRNDMSGPDAATVAA